MELLRIGTVQCFVAAKKDGIPWLYFKKTAAHAASEALGTWQALITSMLILHKL